MNELEKGGGGMPIILILTVRYKLYNDSRIMHNCLDRGIFRLILVLNNLGYLVIATNLCQAFLLFTISIYIQPSI